MGKQGQKAPDPGESTPTHLPMAPRPGEDAKSVSSKSANDSTTSSISLNTFLAKYTSEDNQSFQEILENSEKKHKIKVRQISNPILVEIWQLLYICNNFVVCH